MSSYNRVTMLGHLGRNPDLVEHASMPIAKFSVATSERRKVGAEWKQETEWHNIVCFGKTAENVISFLKKGSQVLVEGKLKTESWDDKTTGQKRYATSIIANEIKFISKKEGAEDGKVTHYNEASTFETKDSLDDIPF